MADAAKVLETGEETLEEPQLRTPRATRVEDAEGMATEEALGTDEYQPYCPRAARGAAKVGTLELEGVPEGDT